MPEGVKLARHAALMEVQQGVAFEWAAAQVGQEMPVVIDGADPEFPGHYQGAHLRRQPGHRLRGAG